MTGEETIFNYPANVIRVVDSYTVIMNRGSKHGVKKGKQFLVYITESEEMIDPESGKSLGRLEVVRGTVEAVHVQEQITTLKSNRFVSSGRIIRRIRNTGAFSALAIMGADREIIEEPTKEPESLGEVSKGDSVRPI